MANNQNITVDSTEYENLTGPQPTSNYGQAVTGINNPIGSPGNAIWQPTPILSAASADLSNSSNLLTPALNGTLDWNQVGENMAATQSGVPNIPQQPVTGIRNDATDTEKARILSQSNSQEHSREDFCSIGTVYLSIPPTQISISEEKHNFRFKVLRGGSDIITTTGRSTTRIDLEVVFNGLDDINNKLRPLLAQFKCTPFLPIDNSHIRAVLQPDSVFTDGEEDDQNNPNEVDQINSNQSNTAASIQNLISQVQSLQSIGAISSSQVAQAINLINQWYGAGNSMALTMAGQYVATSPVDGSVTLDIKGYIYSLVTSSGTPIPSDQVAGLATIMNNIQAIGNNAVDSLSAAASIVTNNITQRYVKKQIVGALSQITISTMPGYPGTLTARISMYVFNYAPYSFDFSYIQGYDPNQYTPDITQCDLFIDWYSNRFLSTLNQGSGLGSYTEDDSIIFTYIDQLSYQQLITDNPASTPEPKVVTISDTANAKTVLTGISVTMRNVIKFLPVLSDAQPTCQYMGAYNTSIHININSTEKKKVAQIKNMLDSMSRISRRANRYSRYFLFNVENALVNLCGFDYCIVEGFSVDTVPGSPGLYAVGMDLTEAKISQENLEQLDRILTTSESNVLAGAQYIVQSAQNYANDTSSGHSDTAQLSIYYNMCFNNQSTSNASTGNSPLLSSIYNTVSGYNSNTGTGYSPNNGYPASIISEINSIRNGVTADYNGQQSVDSQAAAASRDDPDAYLNQEIPNLNTYLNNFMAVFGGNSATWPNGNLMNWDTESIFAAYCFYIQNHDLIASMLNPQEVGAPGLQSAVAVQASSGATPKSMVESSCYPDLALPRYIDIPSAQNGSEFKLTYRDLGLLPNNPTMSTWSPQTDYAAVEPDIFYKKVSIDDILDTQGTPGMDVGLSNFYALSQAHLAAYSKPQDYAQFLERAMRAKNLSNSSYGVPNAASTALIDKAMGNNYDPSIGSINSSSNQVTTGPSSQSSSNTAQINGKPCVVTGVLDANTFLVQGGGTTYAIRSLDYFPAPDGNSNSTQPSQSPNAKIAARVLMGKTVTPTIIPLKVCYQYGYNILNVSLSGNNDSGSPQNIANLMISAGMAMDQNSNTLQNTAYGNTNSDMPSQNSSQDIISNIVENAYSPYSITKNPTITNLPSTSTATVPTASSVVGAGDNEASNVTVQTQNPNDPNNILNGRYQYPYTSLLFTNPQDQLANNSNFNRFDRYSNDNITSMATRIRYQVQDDMLRMVKAFPTFKFYFVEDTRGEYVPIPFLTTKLNNPNELYSYDAIISIDINRNRKEAADTAIVQILNTKGILDRSRFGLQDDGSNYQLQNYQNSPSPNDDNTTRQMQSIDEFILKPGTRIKIVLGYGSDPTFLENVFTGQVAEVNMGDVITVVAQGYGTELQKDLSGWGSQKEDPTDVYQILSDLMHRDEVEHFGQAEWNPIIGGTLRTWYKQAVAATNTYAGRTYINWGTPGDWLRTFASTDWFIQRLSKGTDNNIHYTTHAWWSDAWKGATFNFKVENQTAWDVFQDVARRFAGEYSAIAQVLPFDDRATIYFGGIDGYYTYSERIKALLNSNSTTLQDRSGQVASAVNNGQLSQPLSNQQVLALCQQVNSLVQQAYNNILNNIGISSNYNYNGPGAANSLQQTAVWLSTQNPPNTSNVSLINSFRIMAENNPSVNSPGMAIGNYYLIPGVSVQTLNQFSAAGGPALSSNALYQVNNGINTGTYTDANTFNSNLSFSNANSAYGAGGQKMMRSYHYYDSFRNIIANSIIASNEDMYNRATILANNNWGLTDAVLTPKSPTGQEMITATASDGIWSSKIVEKIFNEPNANTIPVAWNYALGRLGDGMREMYKGSLTILGDSTVKPHDVIFIDDYYTDMHGPVEVREVNHHFSHDTGFVTNIVPDLIVYTNHNLAMGNDALAGGYYDDIRNVVMMGRNINVSPSNKLTNSTAYSSLNGTAYSTQALDSSVGSTTSPSSQGKIINGSQSDFTIYTPLFLRDTLAKSAATVLTGAQTSALQTDNSSPLNPFIYLASFVPSMINRYVVEQTAGLQFFAGGFTADHRQPIAFTPLIFSNRPYIAGIEGWRHTDWWEGAAGGMRRLIYNTLVGALAIPQTIRNALSSNGAVTNV